MKLAVSNIAWTPAEEPDVAKELQKQNVEYVEIAPTKVWDNPLHVSDEQIRKYKEFWAAHGITIVAFQSMLFGRDDLTIFEDAATRQKTKDYLKIFIELAGRIGAEVLVFGSPKNRRVGAISQDEAFKIAQDFFGELGEIAAKNNTNFCIEPNAEAYDCNFVTTAAQGLELVKKTSTSGFQLHLDTACMTLAKDDLRTSILDAKDNLRHFHISAPFLQPIEEHEVNHAAAATALRDIKYEHFVSIEMRPGNEGQNVKRIHDALKIVKKYYK